MPDYRQSQDLIARGESLLREGDIEQARQMFREAAAVQHDLVEALPEDRARTRSVFGLSAATLYYRAQDLPSAERLACRLLASERVDARSRKGLVSLIERVWSEQRAAEAGLQVSTTSLALTLFGRAIHHGIALLDVVDPVLKAATSYVRRMGALCNGQAFTRRLDDAIRDVEEAYRPLVSEPIHGSYRVDFYLARAAQPALPLGDVPERGAQPSDIIDRCMAFARLVERGDEDAVRSDVPDERYRAALTRILRSLVPDGEDLGEVEIRRSDEPKERAVRLRPAHRQSLGRLVKAVGPVQPSRRRRYRSEDLTGVLRAVDLDDSVVRLVGTGPDVTVEIPDVLADVVGPLLNKRVVIRAHLPPRRSKKWVAEDIDLASAGPS